MIAADDKLVLRWTVTASRAEDATTRVGSVSKANNPVTYSMIGILRLNAAGKVAERWGIADELGVLRQMGALSSST